MKRLICILALITLAAFCLHSQSPFKQSYDVMGDNFAKAYHCNTLDSGIIVIARSTNINSSKYFTIFKTDHDGNLQWSQRYIQPGNCNVSNIVQLPDSSYFFCFVELNFPEKYYIVHLAVNGSHIYCKNFTPPSNYIVAFDPTCIAKSDGHVYIQADLNDLNTGIFGWHLFEVDYSGNVVFSNCYNGSILKCLGRSFTQCANGDLALVGYQRDSVSMKFGPVITRVDSDGVMLWSKLYLDTTTSIAGLSICESTNGNFIVTASHTTQGNEVIRLETDSNGNLLRTREYGHAVSGFSPYTSHRTENNSLIIYGTCDSGSFAMKLDSAGDVLAAQKFYWVVPGKILSQPANQFSFSGVDSQTNHVVLFTSDSVLTSCFGSVMSIDTGTVEFETLAITNWYPVALYDTLFLLNDTSWLAVSQKVCGPVGIDEISAQHIDIRLYPNPATATLSIVSPDLFTVVELLDVSGRIVLRARSSAHSLELDISSLLPGCYVVRVRFENHVESRRLVIE